MAHSISFHTIRLSKRFQKLIGYNNPPLSLSNSEASALLFINSVQNASQSDIAKHLHLEPPTVVSTVDQLEKQGLVIRTRIPNGDRRKYQINLTQKGLKTTKAVEEKTFMLEKYIKKNIPAHDLKSFFKTQDKIFELLSKKGGEK